VSIEASQLKGMTFVRMGITNKFSKNAQKHIKKKEPKDGPQFMVEQTVGT